MAVAGGKRSKKECITVFCEAEVTRARQTLSTALLTLETCRSHRRYSVKVSKHMQYVWLWGPEELNAKQCWCFFTSSTCRNSDKSTSESRARAQLTTSSLRQRDARPCTHPSVCPSLLQACTFPSLTSQFELQGNQKGVLLSLDFPSSV